MGCGPETTNVHSNSVNHSMNHFQKTAFGLLNTPDCTYKSKYSKISKVNNSGLSANRDEIKQIKQLQEFEEKFTNKARPRYPPAKSTAFHGGRQLESNTDEKMHSARKQEKIN